MFFIIVYLSSNNRVNGQNKLFITAGGGFPELVNIGLRYQLNQTQLGMSVGGLVYPDGSEFSISGGMFYHFGGHSKLSERRPWYGRAEISRHRQESTYNSYKYLYLSTRVGRDFNISEKFGLGLDAGPVFQLDRKVTPKRPPSGFDLDLYFSVLPSFGLSFFYKI